MSFALSSPQVQNKIMGIDLNAKLEEVIRIREQGDLVKSRTAFDSLLKQVGRDHRLYARVTGEFVIQLRLEAKRQLEQALSLGRELPEDPTSVRAISHTLIDLGYFESAVPLLQQLSQNYLDNSLRLGEVQSHLAYAYLRTGRSSEALVLVESALKNIEDNTAREKYVEVRRSHTLIVRALINSQLDNRDLAIADIRQAISIAKQGQAVYRLSQAEEILRGLLSD